jgi:hypothetical protein
MRAATAHRVSLRASWHDAWTRIPFLFADELAWRLAPGISTAQLSWDYGLGIRQGRITPQIVERLTDRRRQYVKIEVDGHAVSDDERSGDAAINPLRWFGTIELEGRLSEGLVQTGTDDGTPTLSPRGTQPFAAVGLEQALHRHPIRGATWLDAAGATQRADRPFIFNRPTSAGSPLGNRSASRGERPSYLFSGKLSADGGVEEDKKWSTRSIVEYLCAIEIPKGAGGIEQWSLSVHEDFETFLPDWDVPVIDTANQTTGGLFNLLMPRARMFSWMLVVETSESDVEEGLENDVVKLVPVSLFGSIVRTDLGPLPPNPRQVALQASLAGDLSPDTPYTLEESDIGRIDQARVRGARRTSTCTLSKPDNTLQLGCPDDLKDEYNAGYSAAEGYDAFSKAAKQVANAEVRSADRVATVFRRFAVGTAWNQTVADGLGGDTTYPVFPKDTGDPTDAANKYPVNNRELELCPTLAMSAGFDWSAIGGPTEGYRTPPEKIDDGPHNRLPALVLFKHPYKIDPDDEEEADRYVQVETIGATGRIAWIKPGEVVLSWSGRVEVPHQDRAVWIDVHGQPQHILAYTDFERLPVDEDLGKWDWQDGLFTVSIYDDRYAEGVVPKDAAADDATANTRRELLVDAGDAYRLDYIVPNTVIGVDRATRGLIRCELGGWINDDRKLLAARALQIFSYHGQTRRALQLTTGTLTTQLRLGDYVVSIGREADPREVGTVVSQIVLKIPGGMGQERPASPSIHYTTSFAELEPGAILNRPFIRYHRVPEHKPTKIL